MCFFHWINILSSVFIKALEGCRLLKPLQVLFIAHEGLLINGFGFKRTTTGGPVKHGSQEKYGVFDVKQRARSSSKHSVCYLLLPCAECYSLRHRDRRKDSMDARSLSSRGSDGRQTGTGGRLGGGGGGPR